MRSYKILKNASLQIIQARKKGGSYNHLQRKTEQQQEQNEEIIVPKKSYRSAKNVVTEASKSFVHTLFNEGPVRK